MKKYNNYTLILIILTLTLTYILYNVITSYYHNQYLNSISKTIVVVRHGEKKEGKSKGGLSCKGLNRGLALPDMLLQRYGSNIKGIFAPEPVYIKEPGDGDNNSWYLRPIITIDPLAIRLGMAINIHFNMDDNVNESMLAKKLYQAEPGVYVVAWEHKHIPQLVDNIMKLYKESIEVPDWNDTDFERLYVIRIFKNGQITLTPEKEGLGWKLSDTCQN
jgi:hypothetical protein